MGIRGKKHENIQHSKFMVYFSPSTSRYTVPLAVPKLLVALHVYVPSLASCTLLNTRLPSSIKTTPPVAGPRVRGTPLKAQLKERVGSGNVVQGRVTDREGMAVTFTVRF